MMLFTRAFEYPIRFPVDYSKSESKIERAPANGELQCERDPIASNGNASSPITSTSPINGSAAHADAITRPVSQWKESAGK
jgi:hypothetical protein